MSTARTIFFLSILFGLCGSGCPQPPEIPADPEPRNPDTMQWAEHEYQDTSLTAALLHDKVLGFLVGSAIGDAMGAPTEMWDRGTIGDEYGYVDSLDLVLREPSPEGPWDYNLPPGAGTDDTRWKALLIDYLAFAQTRRHSGRPPTLATPAFAEFIAERYLAEIARLKATEGIDPGPFEANMRRLTWLQEWAKVALAYNSGAIDRYRNALSRFYGGDMACAGMLYAPAVGAYYPGRPEAAYEQMYELGLFDIGYARDISALTAALTAAAFAPEAGLDSFVYVLQEVDPAGFFRSRLIGRVAYQQFRQARAIVRTARRLDSTQVAEMNLRVPPDYPYGELHFARTQRAYELLAEQQQDFAFHAGEIHLINLTALLFTDLDFARAMAFVTNYGRDNDTVGAITGAILGAYHGAAALPAEQREQVIRINREVLDIDLETLAEQLTRLILERRGRGELSGS